jgi:hypothetical protein
MQKIVSSRRFYIFLILILTVSFFPAFALTELERVSIADPTLVNAFGVPLGNNVNVDQQIQISADITNNQKISQTFIYIVQIKNEENFVVSVGWISGQLTPNQILNPSLSWTPTQSGEFTAEIFVWEGLRNHNALSEYTMLQISVS